MTKCIWVAAGLTMRTQLEVQGGEDSAGLKSSTNIGSVREAITSAASIGCNDLLTVHMDKVV